MVKQLKQTSGADKRLWLCFLGWGVILIGLMIALAPVYFEYKDRAYREELLTRVDGSPEVRKGAEGADEYIIEEGEIDSHTVPEAHPRTITINQLSVKARVLPMGLSPDSTIQAPININDAGWYVDGSLSGQEGAVLIDVHASGAWREGLFTDLETLKSGGELSIETGSGEQVQCRVESLESLDLEDIDMKQVLSRYDGGRGVALMTCIGQWSDKDNTFTQRHIVYVKQTGSWY